jgi:hypothetical protein
MPWARSGWLLAGLAAGFLIAGCGGPSDAGGEPARGRVVYKGDKGRPRGGRIEFRSVADPRVIAIGSIDEDGAFAIGEPTQGHSGSPGLPPGEYQVRVLPPKAGGEWETGSVHPKYMDFRTASLKVTVPVPENFTLTLDPPLKGR